MFLEFSDQRLENEFRKTTLQNRLWQIRFNSFAGVLLIDGYIYFDSQFVPPEALDWALCVRVFFMTPLAFAVMALSFFDAAQKKWQFYSVLPLAGIGFGISLFIAGTKSPMSIYFMTIGSILFQIFAFFLLGLQLPAALLTCILAGILYSAAAWWLAPQTFMFVVVNLTAVMVILTLAKWHNEYQERQLFLANKTILASQQARAEADRAKIAWLQNLADFLHHEIRNAFAGARTSIQLLQKRFEIGQDDKHLNRAYASIETIKWHLDKVRDVTSLEKSLASGGHERLALDTCIAEHLETCRNIYPDTRFEISLQAPEAQVDINPDRLRQLLDKLVSNAIEHGEPGRAVKVSTRQNGDEVTLSVQNTGELPPARDKLFEPFHSRSNETDKTSHRHLGIGLYIVKTIAERHGGRASADCHEQARAVVFSVTLPCATQSVDDQHIAPPETPS